MSCLWGIRGSFNAWANSGLISSLVRSITPEPSTKLGAGGLWRLLRVILPVRIPTPELPIADAIEHADDAPNEPDDQAEAIAGGASCCLLDLCPPLLLGEASSSITSACQIDHVGKGAVRPADAVHRRPVGIGYDGMAVERHLKRRTGDF